MTDDVRIAVDLGREALWMLMKLSMPLLLTGLIIGVFISVLQAATQVQEQTLTFIPKILAVVGTLFILAPWMMNEIIDYSQELFLQMGTLMP
jgi:flagellar biosynthetic protein FliQ